MICGVDVWYVLHTFWYVLIRSGYVLVRFVSPLPARTIRGRRGGRSRDMVDARSLELCVVLPDPGLACTGRMPLPACACACPV